MTIMRRGAFLFSGLVAILCSSGQLVAQPDVVTIDDKLAFPESITSLADGTVFLGNSGRPLIYRASPGATMAEPWVTVSDTPTDGMRGLLVDPALKRLWACVVSAPSTVQPPVRPTWLIAIDLPTRKIVARYGLPGSVSLCNDIAIGPDHGIYVSDTKNGRVLRLNRTATALDILIEDKALAGVDGITFLSGKLYVNTVTTSRLFRIPLASDGRAGSLVEITPSEPLNAPDGMRAKGGLLYLADSRSGRIMTLKVSQDRAVVTLLKDGYQWPTAVSPVGTQLWVGESKGNYGMDPKLKGEDPGAFKAYRLPLTQ